MADSRNVSKIIVLVFGCVLILLLLAQVLASLNLPSKNALAAPGAVDCVKGKNGIKGNGCGGTVTLQLTRGGVITSSKGTGLQVLSPSTANGNISIYARSGAGIGITLTTVPASAIIGNSDVGYGVAGLSVDGAGVAGSSLSGTGVFGLSNGGYAMIASGSTKQDRNQGGWVKALVRVNGGSISRCFNSQTATPKTIAPCGFALTKNGTGDYSINFGFETDDRFVAVTPERVCSGICADGAFIPVLDGYPNSNSVRIELFSGGTTKVDTSFMVVVY